VLFVCGKSVPHGGGVGTAVPRLFGIDPAVGIFGFGYQLCNVGVVVFQPLYHTTDIIKEVGVPLLCNDLGHIVQILHIHVALRAAVLFGFDLYDLMLLVVLVDIPCPLIGTKREQQGDDHTDHHGKDSNID